MSTVGDQRPTELLDGMPRILLDTALFSNTDFQEGNIGVTPTSWTKEGTGTATRENGHSFSPELGPGALSALKMVRTGAPNVRVIQRTAAGVVATNEPVMLMCAVYPEGPGNAQVRLDLWTDDALDVTVETFDGGSNLSLAPGQWHFVARWARPQAPGFPWVLGGTKWNARLILAGTSPVNEPVWFAHMHFGVVCEFSKRLSQLELKPKYYRNTVKGDDSYQVVENKEPDHEIMIGMDTVIRDGDNDTAWQRFAAEARRDGTFTLFRESNLWLNRQEHFDSIVYMGSFDNRSRDGKEYFDIEVEGMLTKQSRYPAHVTQ